MQTLKYVLRAAAAAAGLLLGAAVPSNAQNSGRNKPFAVRPVVISRVTVINVRAGRALPNQTVVVSGERIQRVGPAGTVKTPPGALVINGQGGFLLPGLFDSHVHLNNADRESRMLVANGVTFVRDMGGGTADRIAERQRARRGELCGLEMACVGTILDGKPPYHPWSKACDTPDEGRAAVRELKTAGVDQIKVYSLLKPEVLRAIVDEANKCGLQSVGHVPDSMTLEEATQAGQAGVEHLSRYESLLEALLPGYKAQPGAFGGGVWAKYPEIDKTRLRARLRQLAQSGTAHCPTLVLHAGQARLLDGKAKELWNRYALPDDRRSWNEVPAQWADYSRSLAAAFPYLQQTVVELHNARVPLLVGTDLANPGVLAGFAVHQEMQLWQQAGMRPADVLRAATLTPARFFGRNDLGTIEAGKTASLVLTRKNPLLDVRNAGQIEAVWARGRYFDRTALDRLLAEARDDVSARSPAPNQDVRFDLPGEVVAQGRYKLLYQQYGDGAEEFRITRNGDAYHFQGLRRQQGFGRYVTVVTGRWDFAFAPQHLNLQPLVLLPTRERYDVASGRVRGGAVRGGKTIRSTNAAFDGGAFRSDLAAMDFFLFARLKLGVGQQQTVETFRFNGTGGKPQRQTLNVVRQPDEPITPSAAEATPCRHYVLRAAGGPAGAQTDVWVNAQGLPIKQVITDGSSQRSAVLDAPAVEKKGTGNGAGG